MPNTYTQLYIQFVFAVKYRAEVIDASWKDELYRHITSILGINTVYIVPNRQCN
jgi:hypothetical protein